MRQERTHAERLGQGEGRRIGVSGSLRIEGVATGSDVSQHSERRGLVRSLLVLPRQINRGSGVLQGLAGPAGNGTGLRQAGDVHGETETPRAHPHFAPDRLLEE
jgi:hypothetical protein